MRHETKLAFWVVLWASSGILGIGQPQSARALTQPEPGAVPKPSDWDISWPLPAGEQGLVVSGYSPNGGSSLHHYTDSQYYANDYYALDVVYTNYPNNGLGQPVVAIASGTVVKAGWATAGWANYGQRVIIQHDYNGDGHTYISHYAHLNAIYVHEGDHVDKGQVIGELGDSCEGDNQVLSCPYFEPHLHFAIHQDSHIGGSGTGGSYGGHAVVPEPIDGYEDIQRGLRFVSQNNGGPTPPCMVIGLQETILEEDGPCFRNFGPSQYWHDESSGHGGHCIWTYTTDEPNPTNFAKWLLYFDQEGEYDLWAYTPAGFGESQQARYTIRHGASEDQVVVSQAASPDAWVALGTFHFASGGDQWVLLEDNTGEPYVDANTNTKIAFDAIKVAPAQGCECSSQDLPQTQLCERCGIKTRACDGCHWPDWSQVPCENQGECDPGSTDTDQTGCNDGTSRYRVCSESCTWGEWSECGASLPDGGLPDSSPPEDSGTSGGGDGGTGPSVDHTTGGCSCRTDSPGHAEWLLALLPLLFFRRRRSVR